MTLEYKNVDSNVDDEIINLTDQLSDFCDKKPVMSALSAIVTLHNRIFQGLPLDIQRQHLMDMADYLLILHRDIRMQDTADKPETREH